MSGGDRVMVLNTRERLITDDHNRLQAFGGRHLAEVLRRLMNMGGDASDCLELGSFVDTSSKDSAAVATPLKADVLEGLIVQPQAGTLNLLISPGAVGLDDPDGQTGSSDPSPPSSDDSRYKVVIDPGMQIAGSMTIAAGSGSTRIDVIECQRVPAMVLETDTRDVFNPLVGTFSPTAIPKVTESRLTYRVRQGTPGSGYPGSMQGWLPLCVASVPSSATSVDGMTFWDVRPLVKDRINAPHEQARLDGQLDRGARLFANNLVTGCKVYGYSASTIAGYRAGGRIADGLGAPIDVQATTYRSVVYSPTARGMWFLYAVFPAGLPRWVRYNDSPTTPRIPAGPLGVLTVASTPPNSIDGNAIATSIFCPTATGLNVAGAAALLAAGLVGSGGVGDELGFVMREGKTVFSEAAETNAAPVSPDPSSTTGTDHYRLVANVNFPLCAKSVIVALFAGAATGPESIIVYQPGAGWSGNAVLALPIRSSLVGVGVRYVEIPCAPEASANGLASNDIEFSAAWDSTSRSGQNCTVVGWRL